MTESIVEEVTRAGDRLVDAAASFAAIKDRITPVTLDAAGIGGLIDIEEAIEQAKRGVGKNVASLERHIRGAKHGIRDSKIQPNIPGLLPPQS